MSMSKDRVQFQLKGSLLSGIQDPEELLRTTLGLDDQEICMVLNAHIEGITIECRPSQFARFLIRRNDLDGKNDFKSLKPRLIQPAPVERKIIVSDRPARHPSGWRE